MNCSLEVKIMTKQLNKDKYIEFLRNNNRWRVKAIDSPEDNKSIITMTSEGPSVVQELLNDINNLSKVVEQVGAGFRNEVIEEADEEREVSSKAVSLRGNNSDSTHDLGS